MNRLLTNTEFFTYGNEVMVRTADGTVRTLTPQDSDLISAMCDYLATFYSKAYAALCDEYRQSARGCEWYEAIAAGGRRLRPP